jgi:hypothetical protein
MLAAVFEHLVIFFMNTEVPAAAAMALMAVTMVVQSSQLLL